MYDPFARGPFPVGVRTVSAHDTARNRNYPCEIWYPATADHAGQDTAAETMDSFSIPFVDVARTQAALRDAAPRPGRYPLILFSHGTAFGARRMATYLCTHLCSHGYVVAAMDHSELVAPELARRIDETSDEKAARQNAWISNRVPDVQFLLDYLLTDFTEGSEATIDPAKIGVVGYSFGGWTVLAAPEVEPRILAIVALAPGGSSNPKPGIIQATLTFKWKCAVRTLYLVAEDDTMTPLAGMQELFERTPADKQMVILRCADHVHFLDNVEHDHELMRSMPWTEELAWIPKEMRPISELCSGEQSHMFVRGLALSHMDMVLHQSEDARRLLESNVDAEVSARGVDAHVFKR